MNNNKYIISEIGKKYINYCIFFIFILSGVILIIFRNVSYDLALLGLAIIFISLLPLFIFFHRKQRDSIPFIETSGIFYAIFFGLPVFTIQLAWVSASDITIYAGVPLKRIEAQVLLVVLAGIGVYFLAAFFAKRSVFAKIPHFRLPQHLKDRNLKPLIWILLVLHQLNEYDPKIFGYDSSTQVLEPAGYLSLGMLFLLSLRRRLSKIENFLLILFFIPLELYFRLKLMMLTDILLLLVFFFFIFLHEKLYKTILAVIIFMMLIVSMYSVSTAMRSSIASESDGVFKVGKAYLGLMLNNEDKLTLPEEGKIYNFHGKFNSIVKRTAHLWVFHIVSDKTPKEVPYWEGETYKPLLTSFIPRLIYAEKPEERLGNKFGRAYGFLVDHPHPTPTSVNVPWITELLMNFGQLGVILGMATFGVFMAFLDKIFISRKSSDLEFVLGLTLIFPLVYPESNFSVMTGSMFLVFLFFVLYFIIGAWFINKANILKSYINRTK